jgi:mRNA interferase HigB
VNVISRPALNGFAAKHPDSKTALDAWYKAARRARWRSLHEVRQVYPHADLVGTCTVFNIAGNKYRLVTKIKYAGQVIYIRQVLTHPEYNRRRWKDECSC